MSRALDIEMAKSLSERRAMKAANPEEPPRPFRAIVNPKLMDAIIRLTLEQQKPEMSTVNNYLRSGAAGFMGLGGDLANAYAMGMGKPQQDVIPDTEDFGEVFDADLESPSGVLGQIGFPDWGDASVFLGKAVMAGKGFNMAMPLLQGKPIRSGASALRSGLEPGVGLNRVGRFAGDADDPIVFFRGGRGPGPQQFRTGGGEPGAFGEGIYFTQNIRDARNYAGEGGNIAEATLDIKNPYVINLDERRTMPYPFNRTVDSDGVPTAGATHENARFITEYLQGKGFDGVIVTHGIDAKTGKPVVSEAVAFSKSQINPVKAIPDKK